MLLIGKVGSCVSRLRLAERVGSPSSPRRWHEGTDFQALMLKHRIIMHDGLFADWLIFLDYLESRKKLYLLFDSERKNYDEITNITGAMQNRSLFNGCDFLYNNTHKCDKACLLVHRTATH
jgi:hypothetical protein